MNETMNTLLNRYSSRSFRPEHIATEQLEQILQAGLKAPTGRNAQTPRFLVVTNDALVKKLSEMNAAVMGAKMDPFYGAKDVIAVLVKKEYCWAYDGSIAMGNMLNAAFSLGIGSCWIHRAKEVFESEEGKAILKEAGFEEELEGVGFCILGYSDEAPAVKAVNEGRVRYVK